MGINWKWRRRTWVVLGVPVVVLGFAAGVAVVGPSRGASDEATGIPATATGPAASSTQGASMTTEVKLQHTDVTDAARLVNAMFNPQNNGLPEAKATVHAEADVRTNTVVLTGGEDQVKQAVTMLEKIEAIPVDYLKAATRPGGRNIPKGTSGMLSGGVIGRAGGGGLEYWSDEMAVKNKGSTPAAELLNAWFKSSTEAWKGLQARGDNSQNFIVLQGSAQQVRAAKALIAAVDAKNRWAALENDMLNTEMFIMNLKTNTAADMAATMNERYGNEGFFVAYANVDGLNYLFGTKARVDAALDADGKANALIITCLKRVEDKIKAEVAALDRAAEAGTKPAGDRP